jgi:hypothetical protein
MNLTPVMVSLRLVASHPVRSSPFTVSNLRSQSSSQWSGVTGNSNLAFDTEDWNAQAGGVTAAEAFGNWKTFLDGNLAKMDTGFISLEHDLYPVTVGLAINYYLPDGSFPPPNSPAGVC